MNRYIGTPGPWRMVQFRNEYGLSSFNIMYGTDHICEVSPNREKPRANAKLIAAAPDLLQALQKLKSWVEKLDDWKGEDPPYELVETALKKALEI